MGKISFKLSHSSFLGYNSSELTDEQLIEGIKNNSNQTLEFIYKNYYARIKKMVWSFRNTFLQPEDIFQEGLTRVVINIQNGKFRGESSFYTYLNSVCRNVCLKELAKHRHYELNCKVEDEDDQENFELMQNLLKVLKRLEDKCRNIIELRFNLENKQDSNNGEDFNKTIAFEEIAEKLNLTSDNARQRFKRCLDKLRENVLSDPELNDYYT